MWEAVVRGDGNGSAEGAEGEVEEVARSWNFTDA